MAIVKEFISKNGFTKIRIDDQYVCRDPEFIQKTLDEIGQIAYESRYAQKMKELQEKEQENENQEII